MTMTVRVHGTFHVDVEVDDFNIDDDADREGAWEDAFQRCEDGAIDIDSLVLEPEEVDLLREVNL